MSGPVRVLIVDDSALVRRALTQVLAAWPDIEVIGTACDAYQAAARLRESVPDVILLDIEMPKLDGLAFLRQLMKQHPIPTVICSAVAPEGSATAIAALEAGATDIIVKPNIATRAFFEDSSERFHDAICAAAGARLFAGRATPRPPPRAAVKSLAPTASAQRASERVIVIGASTGGTEAIRVFLERCDTETPGVVIVQHMPPGFTASLARRLDQLCAIRVKEAEHGEPVLIGQALIAPGDRHVALRCAGKQHYVELLDTPPVSRHRPSVDVLFNSAAASCGQHCVGVIMTGMGDDGARGLRALRDAGAQTLAQDEASCVVYGMPREAVKMGGVGQLLPLRAMSSAAIAAARGTHRQ
jgi:two-component system, chemotaxis family, protein-glutamate methylesterase/glutaminase